MRNHGYIIALPLSNLLCIEVTSMIVFSSSNAQTMCLSFFFTLTANILTFSFHLNWKKTVNSLFLMTRSNSRFSTSVYRKPTFSGLFTNFHSFVPLVYKRSHFVAYFTEFSTSALAMKTFTPNSKSFGNCST